MIQRPYRYIEDNSAPMSENETAQGLTLTYEEVKDLYLTLCGAHDLAEYSESTMQRAYEDIQKRLLHWEERLDNVLFMATL